MAVEASSQSDDGATDSDDSEEPIQRQDTETMIGREGRTELVRIATALSRRRSSVAVHPHPSNTLGAIDEYDTVYDPEHHNFDLSKWLHRFIGQLQEQGLTARRTGVTYRNLDVFGSGSALQLQQTVGSVLMAPARLGEFFSFGKKEPKHILHGFEGLLKEGELLVVLGRPGSGCSTLLKTLCGELDGLNLGANSSIHYNGIPQKQMQKEFKGETVYNQEVLINALNPPS